MTNRDRSFTLVKEPLGASIRWNLRLTRAPYLLPDELKIIESELEQIVTKHKLTPEGGLYNANGGSLGGMYVPDDKLDEVIDDLGNAGYSASRT